MYWPKTTSSRLLIRSFGGSKKILWYCCIAQAWTRLIQHLAYRGKCNFWWHSGPYSIPVGGGDAQNLSFASWHLTFQRRRRKVLLYFYLIWAFNSSWVENHVKNSCYEGNNQGIQQQIMLNYGCKTCCE